MISTHAPKADQIGIGAPQRPKSSLYGWDGNGEGVSVRSEQVTQGDGAEHEAVRCDAFLCRQVKYGVREQVRLPSGDLGTTLSTEEVLALPPNQAPAQRGESWGPPRGRFERLTFSPPALPGGGENLALLY